MWLKAVQVQTNIISNELMLHWELIMHNTCGHTIQVLTIPQNINKCFIGSLHCTQVVYIMLLTLDHFFSFLLTQYMLQWHSAIYKGYTQI